MYGCGTYKPFPDQAGSGAATVQDGGPLYSSNKGGEYDVSENSSVSSPTMLELENCMDDAECDVSQFCDTESHTCVECTKTSPCTGGLVCNTDFHKCEFCTQSQPCPQGQTCMGGRCSSLSSCSATDTCETPGETCDFATDACVTGCVAETDCAYLGNNPPWICDDSKGAHGACVECVSTQDCRSGLVCDQSGGTCVQCIDNSQCASTAICQNNTCIEVTPSSSSAPVSTGEQPEPPSPPPSPAVEQPLSLITWIDYFPFSSISSYPSVSSVSGHCLGSVCSCTPDSVCNNWDFWEFDNNIMILDAKGARYRGLTLILRTNTTGLPSTCRLGQALWTVLDDQNGSPQTSSSSSTINGYPSLVQYFPLNIPYTITAKVRHICEGDTTWKESKAVSFRVMFEN